MTKTEVRNGGHRYGERIYEVCGKTFWPVGPNTRTCSIECRKEKKRRDSRAEYAQNHGTQEAGTVAV